MPKRARTLSAIEVKRCLDPGMYAVGEVTGLYLQVKSLTARSWVLKVTVGTKRRVIGLGSYPTVSLQMVREKARTMRQMIDQGIDPLAHKRQAKAILGLPERQSMTFSKAAQTVSEIKAKEFRNPKHRKQWLTSLETHAFPGLGSLPVEVVQTKDVMGVLQPIWMTIPETAVRVRQRIEAVLDWAKVSEYRQGENPARWRGHLDQLLPTPAKVRPVQHFEAMPFKDIPAFLPVLRQQTGMGARALEFLILTAARSGEVRKALWGEVSFTDEVWTIPAAHTKAHREHRIPLSGSAVSLLNDLPRFHKVELLFPSARHTPLSDMTLTRCLQRMNLTCVPHGFRSSFKTWASECTSFPREVIEASLAHVLENKTEAAYWRGDFMDKRQQLMEQWAQFCEGGGDEPRET